MRIGQLAAASGVTTKAIRFYEKAGVLPAPARQASGYRQYDHGAIERLAFVRAAQAAGLTLRQITDVVSARENSGPPCQHVVDLLEQHAGSLERRIAELTALLAQVRRLGHRATTLDPAQCHPSQVCHVIPPSDVGTPSS
ncbi:MULTISPECIES: heavy metal-responsive transcriptional regulator [Cellulomonas]|jgi:DNA-binding transcriptional MerR regulator|uniref:Transcriptional regulator, MerR family n=2 Tax=Cellulomonas TaxID=1707 RepID=F8A422_CELGA|nr:MULTISPECIES: heavy metal-responsive transcriptional regulator [Cellulomonas]AEI10785.1 transcriptional regulator, MerR family [Cellulomonas gilvus ATCC 13127]NKY38010.1 heavy metal-responsive transcriptional regulator [Cellulomonas septica]HWB36602.1 heavy metal-responsive transcriptional regulator [Rugosimonospora sp.]